MKIKSSILFMAIAFLQVSNVFAEAQTVFVEGIWIEYDAKDQYVSLYGMNEKSFNLRINSPRNEDLPFSTVFYDDKISHHGIEINGNVWFKEGFEKEAQRHEKLINEYTAKYNFSNVFRAIKGRSNDIEKALILLGALRAEGENLVSHQLFQCLTALFYDQEFAATFILAKANFAPEDLALILKDLMRSCFNDPSYVRIIKNVEKRWQHTRFADKFLIFQAINSDEYKIEFLKAVVFSLTESHIMEIFSAVFADFYKLKGLEVITALQLKPALSTKLITLMSSSLYKVLAIKELERCLPGLSRKEYFTILNSISEPDKSDAKHYLPIPIQNDGFEQTGETDPAGARESLSEDDLDWRGMDIPCAVRILKAMNRTDHRNETLVGFGFKTLTAHEVAELIGAYEKWDDEKLAALQAIWSGLSHRSKLEIRKDKQPILKIFTRQAEKDDALRIISKD